MAQAPVVLWFRRDLRTIDHPALVAACESGRPVVPVFVLDERVEAAGAAPTWRWGESVGALASELDARGSRLILRRGRAAEVIPEIAQEVGAGDVWWTRAYDGPDRDRDRAVASALEAAGIGAKAHAGHLMFEPATVETNTGGFYKVYTPYWKSVRSRDVAEPLSAPSKVPAPDTWPRSESLADWEMGRGLSRGLDIVAARASVGQEAASQRLGTFMAHRVDDYAAARDRLDIDGTSGLSENLAYGEISPRQCWHAGRRAMEEGKAGAETFLKELVWREFAYHLVWHTPRLTRSNWREDWDAFPWNTDERLAEVKAWKQGRTGMAMVDAAMREMYVTGRMHNRGRMIVASYLTKHLMTHWRVGHDWFVDCLIDWDPASNALGWQWSAGSGPDATPYFRVFNPETQAEKFDPDGAYRRRWIAEGQSDPPQSALDYFEAIPRSWPMSADDAYPAPVVGAKDGRERALEAYGNRDF